MARCITVLVSDNNGVENVLHRPALPLVVLSTLGGLELSGGFANITRWDADIRPFQPSWQKPLPDSLFPLRVWVPHLMNFRAARLNHGCDLAGSGENPGYAVGRFFPGVRFEPD